MLDLILSQLLPYDRIDLIPHSQTTGFNKLIKDSYSKIRYSIKDLMSRRLIKYEPCWI